MKTRSCLFYFLILIMHAHSALLAAGTAADISFLVADLKYNREQGVKICEIQLARNSKFDGSSFAHQDDNHIAERFFEVFTQYTSGGWIHGFDVCDKRITHYFKANGWAVFYRIRELEKNETFLSKSKLPLYDPDSLLNYHAALYTKTNRLQPVEKFRQQHPGILLIDRATVHYCVDKGVMSHLFDSDAELQKLRPKWDIYRKKYSSSLSDRIINRIEADHYVIKPLNRSKGTGVIIVHKDNLKKTLKIILRDRLKAKNHKDKAYQYWAKDHNDTFLIEEFVASDPVSPPYLGSGKYDGTMRVVFALIQDHQEQQIIFLDKYWKLPKCALGKAKSLNDMHKSCGEIPFYAPVDPETGNAVEEQLRNNMLTLYRIMQNEP